MYKIKDGKLERNYTTDDAVKDLANYDGMVLCWYTPETWQQLKAVADDELADTFEDFVRNATKEMQQLEARGIEVEKFYIDVDHMAAWCKRQGYRVDEHGRALYSSMLSMHDGELFDINTPVENGPGRMQ